MRIQFTSQDFRDLSVTSNVIKQVANSHFGLGGLTCLMKMFDIADMGILIVGRGGIGKTTTLKAVEQLQHKQLFAKEFTQAGVTDEINMFLSNTDTTWVCYDLSKMSVFFAENMLRVVCALITDHEIQTQCSMYTIDIKNANVSWLAASTYAIYKRLITSDLWEGTYRERICRIYQFPYRRRLIHEKPPTINMPGLKFSHLDDIYCAEEYRLPAARLLSNQFSHERTTVYAPKLLKASASLNQRQAVTLADLKFLSLFEFSFQVEHRLGRRMGLASPLYLDAEAVALVGLVLEHRGITAEEIFRIHRSEPQYTINTFMNNQDIFYSPDSEFAYPPERRRMFLQPALLGMINDQYDFEEMCLRL